MKKRILCAILGVIIVFGSVAFLSSCGKTPQENPTTENVTETTTEENVTIEEPVSEKATETTKTTTKKHTENTTQKKVVTTKKQEPVTQKITTTATTKKQIITTKKAVTTTKKQPGTTKKQVVTTKKHTEKQTTYSCGCKNHKCTAPEDHAFLVSLENKGCSICGSHSCPSFYALDEWGQQGLDITKCPQYSTKKDPTIYCQVCGRKNGLGDNGTCVRFTVDTECPICGKMVKAKTCHTH